MSKTDFNIKITENNTKKVLSELKQVKTRILTKWGLKWQSLVTPLVPVDTGKLRQSMSFKVTEDTTEVGSNVEYAPTVNNGRGGRKAHKFMEKSILNNKEIFKEIAESELKK